MPSEEQSAEERNRREREDADVEAHGQKLDDAAEDEAGRRRKRRVTETPDEDDAGRRRR